MRRVQVVLHGVWLVRELLCEVLVRICLFGNVLYEVRNLVVLPVSPRRSVAPVVVEALLYGLHLLACSLFGIFLHAHVDGSVYLESVCIEVQFVDGVVSWD